MLRIISHLVIDDKKEVKNKQEDKVMVLIKMR